MVSSSVGMGRLCSHGPTSLLHLALHGSQDRRGRSRIQGTAAPFYRLDVASLDELGQVGGRHPHVPADPAEADPALGDESADESNRCSEPLGHLLNRQQLILLGCSSGCVVLERCPAARL